MVAFLKGVRDYQDAFFAKKNEAEAVADLTKTLPMRDPAMWVEQHPWSIDPNGRTNVADIVEQGEFYKAQGYVTGPIPDMRKFVDPSFAEAAVKILGQR